MAAVLPDNQLARKYGRFVRLVAVGTGLAFPVVFTWTMAEKGPDDNPLNIGPGNHYGSPVRAAVATVALLRSTRGRSYGYDKILASASKNHGEQLKAIAESSWDVGHYRNGELLKETYSYWFPKGEDASVWNWGKGVVTDPGQALADAGSWWGSTGLGQFLGNVTSVQFWIRVLMILLGAIALVGALVFFARELGRAKVIPVG